MKQEKKASRPSRKLQYLQFAAHSASRVPVIVHLSNGTRLTGVVIASDNYMLLLGQDLDDPTPVLVYKRAVTVVTPAGPEGEAVVPVAETSPDFVRLFVPRTRKRR
ncbi:RNA chaperone Hfq [Cupriavidus plantarum]|uniref:RNA chaperone Hfq n=1 Tax=Cupriavidus plantarum TaxID=942865 RepID=UPI000E22928C|nr:RNA chaperone Hfq [Cupriavidus plantarum]NYI01148.1 host factor-I protein [Cupriavidus plantarum]REE94017.1 host factor-I protein [Cupriavidus plantarum]